MIDKELFKLISENEFHVYRNENKEVVKALLFLYHFDLDKLTTDCYKSYLRCIITEERITLKDDYFVIDVLDYIENWLDHDIENYIEEN